MEIREYKVGIVDDEQPAINLIKLMIKPLGKYRVLFESNDAIKGLGLINKSEIDILFLDYHMPGANGLMLAEEAMKKAIAVIFVSADPSMAIEGFEVNSVDFIQKPFTQSRLNKALKRALEKLNRVNFTDQSPTNIIVKESNHKAFINLDITDIIYFQGANQYTELVTKFGEKYINSSKLKTLEFRYQRYLVRIHKSTLVNKREIVKITNTHVIMSNKMEFEIGKVYRTELAMFIDNHQLE
jgi:two-component system response regulator AlgR